MKLEGATWQAAPNLEPGVFPLKPFRRSWYRDRLRKAAVYRRGFQLVPDFSGTVHGNTGCTLDAEIADCLDWKQKPRREGQLRAYIALSRIKLADNLLVAQPYNPWLFRHGELPRAAHPH